MKKIIIGLLVLGVISVYIFTPLGDDLKTFMAAARMADLRAEPFPFNIYRAWELKPIGNRFLMYALYKPVDYLIGFSDKILFEVMLKSFYLFIVFTVTIFWAIIWSRKFGWNRKIKLMIIILLLSTFVLSSPELNLQPEEISLLLVLLSGVFALGGRWVSLLAGLPLAYLWLIKGITFILAVEGVVILYYLWRKEKPKKIIKVGFSWIFFSLILGLIVKIFFPLEIKAMELLIAQRASRGIEVLPQFLIYPVWLAHLPLLVPSFALIVIDLGTLVQKGSHKKLSLGLLLFGMSFSISLIQKRAFRYDLLNFVIPTFFWLGISFDRISREITDFGQTSRLLMGGLTAIYLLLLLVRPIPEIRAISIGMVTMSLGIAWLSICSRKELDKEKKIFRLMVLILITELSVWLFNISKWGITRDYASKRNLERLVYSKIDNKHQISREPSVLYLSGGTTSYYLGTPSACREFYPVTVQNTPDELRESSKLFMDSYNCAFYYSGKYIIWEPSWFKFDKLAELKAKIDSKFEQIDFYNINQRSLVILKNMHY